MSVSCSEIVRPHLTSKIKIAQDIQPRLVKNVPVKPICQTCPSSSNASEGPLTNVQLGPIPSKLASLQFGARKLHIFERGRSGTEMTEVASLGLGLDPL